VVTKSIVDFDCGAFPLGARRVHVDKAGMWALSTFRRETLTVERGEKLVAARHAKPVSPSSPAWGRSLWTRKRGCLPVSPCRRRAHAWFNWTCSTCPSRAAPRPCPGSCLTSSGSSLITWTSRWRRTQYRPSGALCGGDPGRSASCGIFAIDSVRVPVPIDLTTGMTSRFVHAPNAGDCSLFGEWQKPLSLQYAKILAERVPQPYASVAA